MLISTQKMMGGSPPVYTSAWEQAEEAYPHIHIFAVLLLLAALAFLVGIALVAVSAFRSRRTGSYATPTI